MERTDLLPTHEGLFLTAEDPLYEFKWGWTLGQIPFSIKVHLFSFFNNLVLV